MKQYLTIILVTVLFGTMLVTFNINPAEAEPNIVNVLGSLGFANIQESTAETFGPTGSYNVTLYAEWADFHDRNNLTYYRVGTNEYGSDDNLIFSGPEGNHGDVTPPISKVFTVSNEFGLAFGSPDHSAIYFVETSRNPDGLKHAMVYKNLDDPNMYLIGFENLYGVDMDRDYDDMVISLKINSEPVNIAGVNWYVVKTASHKAFVFLDGGPMTFFAPWNSLTVLSFDNPGLQKNRRLPFINDLVRNGFTALINKDDLGYDGSQTFVAEAAIWLTERSYQYIYLSGFSAGGVVVANEIQRDYALLFSAAVVASAPVDQEDYTGIFQSAHTASQAKVQASFIAPESDPEYLVPRTYDQMSLYYSNMILGKEWHSWYLDHDVFPNTCIDHPGENLSTAVLNWYNAPHPPSVHFSRPNRPSISGPESGSVCATYTYNASAVDNDGNNVRYHIDWGDDSTDTTVWYPSEGIGSIPHSWSQPGTYTVSVQAQGINGFWSDIASLTVAISYPPQNDAGTGGDAGNDFTSATYIDSSLLHRSGMLFPPNGFDLQDWYKFHAETGQGIQVRVTNAKARLYEPSNGYPMTGTDLYEFNYTCDAPGDWVIRIRGTGEEVHEIQYSFLLYVNSPPNLPTVSGVTNGYVYSEYNYSANATDPNVGDHIQYEFVWEDDTSNTTTDFLDSGVQANTSHTFTRPDVFDVRVKAQDEYGGFSWSNPLAVTIRQNDANTGGDAGSDFNSATYISWSTPTYWGTLYASNPTDTNDYYKYYVYNGQTMYASMTPPTGVNFDLELYNPAGVLKAGSYRGANYMDEVSYTADSSGYWRIRINTTSGEGQYSFFWGSAPPGGGGDPCPTLFAWNGTAYVDEGIMNIHNPSGEDVLHEALIKAEDVNITNCKATFRLREGWPSLNFSESIIDQVKLYAVDSFGNRYLCPLMNATHSKLGNVWLQLLFSDNWKTNLLLLETIDLTFLVPYQNIQSYVLIIEGCNRYKQ